MSIGISYDQATSLSVYLPLKQGLRLFDTSQDSNTHPELSVYLPLKQGLRRGLLESEKP